MQRIARLRGIAKNSYHVFLCHGADLTKCCQNEVSEPAWNALRQVTLDLQKEHNTIVLRSKAGCLRFCREGPICVIYPGPGIHTTKNPINESVWYSNVHEDVLPDLVRNHVLEGIISEEHRIVPEDEPELEESKE